MMNQDPPDRPRVAHPAGARHTRSFADLLRHYRERAGLTQADLAERAGLTAKAIGALERGARSQPYLHTVHALASALALSGEERDGLLAARKQRGAAASAAAPAPPASHIPNLPAQPPELIGREDERAELIRRLEAAECRLVTLVGPGGIGKTSLALRVASDIAYREDSPFANRVMAVPLAAVTTAADVPLAIVSALGDPIQGARPVADQLIAILRERELLLVLDNLEHLLGAQDGALLAGLIARIIAEAPGVRLLGTSRERLGLRDEVVLELGGLGLPTTEGGPRIERSEAVQLFLERARRGAPAFSLTSKNRAAVVHICRRLEGMPLAIELAAAWTRTLSASEIAAEVDRALDFLTLADRDAPQRHRSMRAALDHSWALLSDTERQTLARLSVFSGGFDREAAGLICAVGSQRPPAASLAILAALLDKSLVRREEIGGTTRYSLHELVRQYAAERLGEDPAEQAAAEARHTACYAGLVQRALDVHTGIAGSAMGALLDREIDNLRAAWGRAAAAGDSAALAAMAQGLRMLYDSHGWLLDAAALFGVAADALRAAGGDAVAVRGLVLGLQGFFLVRTGHLARARPLLETGLALLQASGSDEELAEIQYSFGIVDLRLGQYAESHDHFTQAAELASRAGNRFRQHWAAFYLGRIAQARGEYLAAAQAYQAFLEAWRGQDYPRGEAVGRAFLGEVARLTGQPDRAAGLLRECLRIAGASREKLALGLGLTHLGALAHDRGAWEEAGYLLAEAADSMREMGDTWLLGLALCGLARTAQARGDARAALRACGEVLELIRRGETGLTAELAACLAPLLDQDGRSLEALGLLRVVAGLPGEHETLQRCARQAADLERRLDAARRAAAAELAGAMPLLAWLDELIAQPQSAPAAAPAVPAAPAGGLVITETGEVLSPREVQVLRLLIAGANNQSVADTLVISLHTAKHHVASILQKLGVTTRTQAALRGRALGVEPLPPR